MSEKKTPKLVPKDYKIYDLGIVGTNFISQMESVVYRGEKEGREIALKIYNMHSVIGQEHKLTLEELTFYQEITNRVKTRFDGHRVRLPTSEEDYKIEIIPIDIVGRINEVWIGSISKFVEGKTLPLRDQLGYREDVREKLVELSCEINQFLGSNFYIHPMNVKPNSETNKLVITDVCDQIPKLQHLYGISPLTL